MFTLAICTILNGCTQVNIKILLIQRYHTTCVSFSCGFSTIHLLSKYENSSMELSSVVVSDLVGKPEYRFSRHAA